MTTVAALLTCHNRRDTTLQALKGLANQTVDPDTSIVSYVVDAGSTDGTSDAIVASFPDANLIQGSADLFWNSGMRAAWAAAEADGPDFYLWVNDDTTLDQNAVQTLVTTHAELLDAGQGQNIIVGSARDPKSGELSYGGVDRLNRLTRPLAFDMTQPLPQAPREVETMNGNCVLVPSAIHATVGILDPAFTHAMGDYDYGLRARAMGFGVWLAPGTVGTCARNPAPAADRTAREELKRLRSVKGIPGSEWKVFARRWAGPAWPIFWASPFIKGVAGRLHRRIA